jgi:hypothetical protein
VALEAVPIVVKSAGAACAREYFQSSPQYEDSDLRRLPSETASFEPATNFGSGYMLELLEEDELGC